MIHIISRRQACRLHDSPIAFVRVQEIEDGLLPEKTIQGERSW